MCSGIFGSTLAVPGDAGHAVGRASAPCPARLWLFPWVEVVVRAGSRVGSCHVHPPCSSSVGACSPVPSSCSKAWRREPVHYLASFPMPVTWPMKLFWFRQSHRRAWSSLWPRGGVEEQGNSGCGVWGASAHHVPRCSWGSISPAVAGTGFAPLYRRNNRPPPSVPGWGGWQTLSPCRGALRAAGQAAAQLRAGKGSRLWGGQLLKLISSCLGASSLYLGIKISQPCNHQRLRCVSCGLFPFYGFPCTPGHGRCWHNREPFLCRAEALLQCAAAATAPVGLLAQGLVACTILA